MQVVVGFKQRKLLLIAQKTALQEAAVLTN